ncbi:MAG: hypothetical protein D4R66_07725 [Opitutales bacterium]|nr:MAG: hypothetical protein D4R66_07725 [Opitutales bacterium]
MSKRAQVGVISTLAFLGYLALSFLPDTQCALLHGAHEPLLVRGVEFCGINEEANYYSPQKMRFPVKMELTLNADGPSFLWLKGEDNRPLLDHEISLSHTQKIHLHLRQIQGERAYVHLHPAPTEDGRWSFLLPSEFSTGKAGETLQAFADFIPRRSERVMLAECRAPLPVKARESIKATEGLRLMSHTSSTFRTGQTALIRVKLAGKDNQAVKLFPLMGSLGHAVLFGDAGSNPGYAHMHPSLEGGEYDGQPSLAFRLRLPAPGDYDFWLNVNDGADQYLRFTLTVTQ